jgi:hypothetical protein
MYRTAPLAGLWSHQKGSFYHGGRFATLKDVVDHYNALLKLGLTEPDKADLIEYLKSLQSERLDQGCAGSGTYLPVLSVAAFELANGSRDVPSLRISSSTSYGTRRISIRSPSASA